MEIIDHVSQLKKEIDSCQKPLFFFDDDIDGLCSFLICYRYKRVGKGIVVKTSKELGLVFINKVREYGPDKIFVLDVPLIDQEFINQAGIPLVWVDHHGPFLRKNVKYINPRLIQKDIYFPTTLVCYTALKNDMWIAALGIIGDAALPDFIDEFSKKYPDILPSGLKEVEEIKFKTRMGELIALLSFILKGKNQDVLKTVRVLTRIEDPHEILDCTTARGKFVHDIGIKIKKNYDALSREALKSKEKDGFVIFVYAHTKYSFTTELANELLYKHPDSVVVVAREKLGEYKMSMRARHLDISKALEATLKHIEGSGGGHEHAVGAVIKVELFDQFIEELKKQIKLMNKGEK
ncbi:MAG: DHH family phosphoesterase [Candidatus Woesearchaeota archaeon]